MDAIDTMKGYTPTFILSTGCETSNKVPIEPIQAMMDVARSYGLIIMRERSLISSIHTICGKRIIN